MKDVREQNIKTPKGDVIYKTKRENVRLKKKKGWLLLFSSRAPNEVKRAGNKGLKNRK